MNINAHPKEEPHAAEVEASTLKKRRKVTTHTLTVIKVKITPQTDAHILAESFSWLTISLDYVCVEEAEASDVPLFHSWILRISLNFKPNDI